MTTGQAGRDIIGFIQNKTKEFRAQGCPIIYICDNHERDDREFDMFPPPHCIAGTEGSEIIDELEVAPGGDKIIKKRRYSAFFWD